MAAFFERKTLFGFLFSLLLALLVRNAAAGLAGALAGSLALTAAAVFRALAQVPGLQRLNVFHGNTSIGVKISIYCITPAPTSQIELPTRSAGHIP